MKNWLEWIKFNIILNKRFLTILLILIVIPLIIYYVGGFDPNNINLYPKKTDSGKWGYVNNKNNLVIEPKFEEAKNFNNGYARVRIGDKWGYLNGKGEVAIEPSFVEARDFKKEGYARVTIEEKWGFKKGVKGIYEQYNEDVEMIIEAVYDDVKRFQEQRAGVKTGDKWGFIDEDGNTIVEPKYDAVKNFNNGMASVKIGDKWGYIDRQGNTIIEPQYERIDEASENMFAVKIDDKWGYIDKNNDIVIEPQFEQVKAFNGGLAPVKLGGKWGFINKIGEFIIEPEFRKATRFQTKKAEVELEEGKSVYVDESGNFTEVEEEKKYRNQKDLAKEKIREIRYINTKGEFIEEPDPFSIPLGQWIESGINFLTDRVAKGTKAFSRWGKDTFNDAVQGLSGIPPWIIIGLIFIIAWRLASIKISIFSMLSLLFVWNLGLWEPTLATLLLVLVSTLLAVVIGIPLGILAGLSNRFHKVIKPILDFMQTMPAFVYLIPAIPFFRTGAVSGIFATLIFAIPPAIRLTSLGIRQVPQDLMEAGNAFGSTRMQKLIKIQLPLATPTIMAGINQTIMLSLSMVVIASMIGAGGLGENIRKALGTLDVPNGFEAGIAVVLLAIILDRITQKIGGGGADPNAVKKPSRLKILFNRFKSRVLDKSKK